MQRNSTESLHAICAKESEVSGRNLYLPPDKVEVEIGVRQSQDGMVSDMKKRPRTLFNTMLTNEHD